MGLFSGLFGVTGAVTIPADQIIASRPTVVGVGSLSFGTGSVSVAWAPHAIDDIGLLQVECDDADTVATPSGWTMVGAPLVNATAGTQLVVFWKRATSDAMPNVSISDVGDHVNARLSIIRFLSTDADPVDIYDTRALTSGSSATCTAPGGTTTEDNCLVCLVFASPTDQSADDAFHLPVNADLFELRFIESNATTSGGGGGLGFAAGIKLEAGAFGDTSISHYNSDSGTPVSILTTSMMIAFKPGGVPGGAGGDGLGPVITDLTPAPGELAETLSEAMHTSITFTLSDVDGIKDAIVTCRQEGDRQPEVVYDDEGFWGRWEGYGEAVETYDGPLLVSIDFTIRPQEGWRREIVALKVNGYDVYGSKEGVDV